MDDKAVVFARGKAVDGKFGRFVSSNTIDLDEVKEKVGRYVEVVMFTPRNAKGPDERSFKIKAGDPKYLPRTGGSRREQPKDESLD